MAAAGLLVLATASSLALRRAPAEPAAVTSPATLAWRDVPSATPAPVTPTPAPSARASVVSAPLAAPAPRRTVAPPPTPAPVVEGDLVELGPDVTRPVRVGGQSASYPERARRMNLRGTVLIDLIVDENGQPTDLQVKESAGPVLDEVVLEAVRTWRFEPARKDGVRVKVRWQVRQTYKTAP